MKTFVTGSTGLLGSNLVKLLLDQGHEVRALARSKEKAAKVLGEHPCLQIVTGDIEQIDGFARALDGTEVLFHTAAYFREYYGPGDHWATLKRINVDGTIQLLTEAEKRDVKKVIYVSSSGVMGKTENGAPADENSPHNPEVESNLYFKSKVEAERAIAEWLKSHQLPVVMILPTAIIGPSDTAPTSLGKAMIDILERKIPAVPPGGFSFIDARDVAQAMINAVEKGKSGERYIIDNGYHSMVELVQTIEKVSGVPAPRIRLPYPVALAVAQLSELQARMTNTAPQLPVEGIRTMYQRRDVSAKKAVRELGTTFRSFEDSIRDEVRWFRENGYVKG